jgi:hypothetical protein
MSKAFLPNSVLLVHMMALQEGVEPWQILDMKSCLKPSTEYRESVQKFSRLTADERSQALARHHEQLSAALTATSIHQLGCSYAGYWRFLGNFISAAVPDANNTLRAAAAVKLKISSGKRCSSSSGSIPEPASKKANALTTKADRAAAVPLKKIKAKAAPSAAVRPKKIKARLTSAHRYV